MHGFLKISGTITNLKKCRKAASFLFTARDQKNIQIGAIASAFADITGQAAALSHHASSMEEDADFVQFELDGRNVSGWLWGSPFQNGDCVEAAVRKHGERYELFGLQNADERVIALYPHCSRGSRSHYRLTFKGTVLANLIFFGLYFLVTITLDDDKRPLTAQLIPGWEGACILLGMFIFITGSSLKIARKWMPFARLTEQVLATLGFPEPSEIDLVKSSRGLRKATETDGSGIFFRY